jgi:G:T-mismatch repair DNA endonuclease (very short patch repair protein)
MVHCLICNKSFENKQSLVGHVSTHKITFTQYKEKFNLFQVCYCEKCGKQIACNKTNKCIKCQDKTGKNNPFFNKHHTENTKKELSKKCSEASKKKWDDLEYRSKVIKNSSKPRSEKFKKEQSERIKKWFEENKIQKEIRSKCMKESWKNGLIVKNGYSSNTSGLEKDLFNELKQFNECFKEKITLKFNKKWFFPDIVDIKRKLIIEYFGDYYHCNPIIFDNHYFNERVKMTSEEIWERDNDRIKIFIKNGYNVIIVWEKSFKENKNYIINYIKTFLI